MNSEEKQMIVNGLGGIIGSLDRFEISAPTANKIMELFRNYMKSVTIAKDNWSEQDNLLVGESMPKFFDPDDKNNLGKVR